MISPEVSESIELVRSSTIRIDEKRWKMISPEVSGSMGQDDCHAPS